MTMTEALERLTELSGEEVNTNPGVTGGGGGGGGGFGGSSSGTAPSSHCELIVFILAGIILSVVGLCGLVGNVITVLTMWSGRNRHSMPTILMALACFDLVVIVVWCSVQCPMAYCLYILSVSDSGSCQNFLDFYYPYMRAYIFPIGPVAALASTWTIVTVAIHRYIAICLPHKLKTLASPRLAQIQVLVIGVVSFAFYIPRFLAQKVVPKTGQAVGLRTAETELAAQVAYQLGYYTVLSYLLQYIVPFGLLIIFTLKLVKVLVQARKKRQEMTRSKRDENGITRSLIGVVLVFMVCQLPAPTRRVLQEFTTEREQRRCGSPFYYFSICASVVVVFNSSVNFLIYCIVASSFRRKMWKMFRQLCRGRAHVHPAFIVSSSAGTAKNLVPSHKTTNIIGKTGTSGTSGGSGRSTITTGQGRTTGMSQTNHGNQQA